MAIPTPEAGLIIAYAYLWHHEHMASYEEGRKDRPSVIVLAVGREDEATRVTVLPITHRPPRDSSWGVEIPQAVKRHLGLDNARSWIIVAEGNEFLWPGYDLRRVSNTDHYDYGFLPPRLFNQVLQAFDTLRKSGKTRLAPRA